MSVSDPAFWVAFAQIIWIDLLLSGDNAVVIALACRSLPEKQRKWGMILGAGVAVGLRVVFAGVITTLMTMPWLKLIGSLLLFWVAFKLVGPSEEGHADGTEAADSLWKAVRTIAIADAVMSLDNVIAIGAAAKGNVFLIAFGLALSIPLIVAGSALVMAMIQRYPVLIWAGGALLGWIAGELLVADPFVANLLKDLPHSLVHYGAAVIGALIVIVGGLLMQRRQKDVVEEV